jgi:class 3 adenylate cyclase/tetratricopeptide (TPR) repeat protein
MGEGRADRRLTAILAADVVGYSRLMAADERGTHARLKALRKEFIEPTVDEHHGRIVKLTGDGALVEFGSVVDAVECAAAIQAGVAERQANQANDRRIVFRIGINIGDVIIEDDDIYGDGVNIAARLEQLAPPGGICIARNVYNQVKNKVAFGFEPMGEHLVKNIPEPVIVYRVLPDPGPVAKIIGRKHAGTPKWRWAALALAAGVILVLGTGALIWLQPWTDHVRPVTDAGIGRPIPDKPAIAVLPFDNLSGDPTRERENLMQRFTDNAQAYDLYLQGFDVYRRKSNQTTYQARELFQQATKLDPNFAAAYARLSHTYFHAWEAGWEGPESLDRAVELAEQAVYLNPSSPEAHEQVGFMYLHRKQFDSAISELERSIALDPDYAKGYAKLGEVLAFAGRPAESFRLVEKAMAMEPYVWAHWYRWILGLAHHGLGEYNLAITSLNRCIKRDPDFHPALVHLTAIYGELGRTKEAKAVAAKILQINPEFTLESVRERWPLKDETFMERLMEGLRKTGLPG